MSRLRRWQCVVVLALAVSANGYDLVSATAAAQASSQMNAEGTVYTFVAGEHYQWKLAAETYMFVVQPDPSGMQIDVSEMRLTRDDERIKTAGFAAAITFDGSETRGLSVQGGSGRLVMARQDLGRHLPINGPAKHLEASGILGGGECHAYRFGTLFMNRPYLASGIGLGLRFVVYDIELQAISETGNHFSMTLESTAWETMHIVIQACNPSTGGAGQDFQVKIDYPAPGDSHAETPSPWWDSPWLLTGGLLVGLGIVAVLVRTRGPWVGKPPGGT